MTEVFLDIPGYKGLYQVSNLGNVYSIRNDKILKPCNHTQGYLLVCLCNNGKQRNPSVHRLVMLTFVGPSNLGVNHIDGDKKNNKLSNLEYVTCKQNIDHAINNKLRNDFKGSNNIKSKLKEEDIPKIKNLYENGLYQKDIAKMYGVCQTTISRVILNKTW